MAVQKSHPLKEKYKQAISNFSNEFVINVMGELVRLNKGMSKNEVISILGEPFKVESCDNKHNIKLVFKINNGRPISTRYSALFFNEELVYVAKLN
jgi:hypothetical protein